MILSSKQLINTLKTTPTFLSFDDTIATIDAEYDFSPTFFINGQQINQANENNGSCKIFSFAKLHSLNKDETLHLFGDFYRNDVLKHPNNKDHQNIRQFIEHGWQGISFEQTALIFKKY